MLRFLAIFAGFFTLFFQYSTAAEPTREELLKIESEQTREFSRQIAAFYNLPAGIDFQEVTDQLLASPQVNDLRKEVINATGRRVFVFVYPSDGFNVKGYISFVPHPEKHPLILYLRGGNRDFAIPNPGSDLACLRNYTVLATTYRGGVSEGQDEFGGNEVNDVKNLVDFIPVLEKKLNISLQNDKKFLIGASRGGMEMFLALARSPELQNRVSKAVSLSGLLDLHHTILDRQDMKQMFIDDFGLIENVNEEEWLNYREPLLAARQIRPDLPILIVQGTADIRVPLDEGYHMVSELEANGNPVTYWEIQGGDHCISNHTDRWELIADWLES